MSVKIALHIKTITFGYGNDSKSWLQDVVHNNHIYDIIAGITETHEHYQQPEGHYTTPAIPSGNTKMDQGNLGDQTVITPKNKL